MYLPSKLAGISVLDPRYNCCNISGGWSMAEAAAVEAEIGKLGTCNWSDGADVVTGVVAVEVAEPDSVEVRGCKRYVIM